MDDISALKSLESKKLSEREISVPKHACVLRGRSESASAPEDHALARVRSFPLSQRLVAALLDEGKGQTSAGRPLRQNPVPEPTWLPGQPTVLRKFNRILEMRVKAELQAIGLMDPDDGDQLKEQIRLVRFASCVLLSSLVSVRARMYELSFSNMRYSESDAAKLPACVGTGPMAFAQFNCRKQHPTQVIFSRHAKHPLRCYGRRAK